MKSIILVSGGFDSIALMTIFKKRGYDLYPISMNYHHINNEIDYAKMMIKKFGYQDRHIIIDFKMSQQFRRSGVIFVENEYVTASYMHSQNTIMNNIAACYAKHINANIIISGSEYYNETPKLHNGQEIKVLMPFKYEFNSNKTLLGKAALLTNLITIQELFETKSCPQQFPCWKCPRCIQKIEFIKSLGENNE